MNFGGIRFIGSTLWTDFQIDADSNLKTELDVLAAWISGKLPTSRAITLIGQKIDGLNKRLRELGFPVRSNRPELSETKYLTQSRARAFANLRWDMPEYAEVYVDISSRGVGLAS